MTRPPFVVLHGANGSGGEMEPLANALREYSEVRSPDLPGHGGRPVPAEASLEDMHADVVAGMDRAGIARAIFVGYSMGGLLALHLARHAPERTAGACAIATKYEFDAATVKRWTYLAQADRLAGNSRGGEMLRAHGAGWPEVTRMNARLFERLGERHPLPPESLARISRPVMLVNSDRDSLVPWEETLALAARIPGTRRVMFHGAAHPLGQVPVADVAREIATWVDDSCRR